MMTYTALVQCRVVTVYNTRTSLKCRKNNISDDLNPSAPITQHPMSGIVKLTCGNFQITQFICRYALTFRFSITPLTLHIMHYTILQLSFCRHSTSLSPNVTTLLSGSFRQSRPTVTMYCTVPTRINIPKRHLDQFSRLYMDLIFYLNPQSTMLCDAFKWARKTPKCSLLVEGSGFPSNTWFLGTPEYPLPSSTRSDQFSRFCKVAHDWHCQSVQNIVSYRHTPNSFLYLDH